MRKRSFLLVASAMSLLVGVVGSGVASAAKGIGPDQHFVGLVNKHSTNAIIVMVCATPDPSETGHPLSGQTIAVKPRTTAPSTSGDTGTRGRSITATIVWAAAVSTANPPLTFTQYGSQTIPTSLVLPCSGSGSVVFSPEPTSKTASSARVAVSFGNITADPPPSDGLSVTPGRTVSVTMADNGNHYRLHPGDHLDVTLTGPGSDTWTEPATSDTGVLKRRAGSSGLTATGAFVAKAQGKAQVTATGMINCNPPCPPPALLFHISVTVVG
jgi:hypothetical protein